jgi:epoxide hydrolase
MNIRPFQIDIPQTQLDDLRSRLSATRMPKQVANSDWGYGPDATYMSELLNYWLATYDWREQEAALNKTFPQFTAQVDGKKIHYVHAKALDPDTLTLVMTHGWPGSFMEFYKVIDKLTHPQNHGGAESDAFNVICPSMTGYGWSEPLDDKGCDVEKVAERQVSLLNLLEIERYGVQGGDWGGIVSPRMALLAPESVVGVHLNMCSTRSTENKQEAKEQGVVPGRTAISIEYAREQKGYAVIQSLKPEQLSFALNDSPMGLAAWIIQCFYMWGDVQGDLESRFTKDELITNVMLYWFTESIPSAIRLYCESLRSGTFGPLDQYVSTPTGVALFKDIPKPKRAWAEKEYNIQHWTQMPRGGHFAALEEPDLLVKDIRSFFAGLR